MNHKWNQSKTAVSHFSDMSDLPPKCECTLSVGELINVSLLHNVFYNDGNSLVLKTPKALKEIELARKKAQQCADQLVDILKNITLLITI